MEARQQGYPAALAVGSRFLVTEIAKIPRFAQLLFKERFRRGHTVSKQPLLYSDVILEALMALDVEMIPYYIEPDAFHAHVTEFNYPRNYAGGPIDEGGSRERKLLEYFVSLDLNHFQPTDTVIDIASERSIFPQILRRLSGATVYQQDIIHPPGIHGDRIGGSAARMPVPDEFADKLIQHNAFEHFEGTTDSDFIVEAWRVLKPGGIVCSLPLYVSDRHCIVTDPLVNRKGVVWDEGAEVIEIPWCHNRFERFYNAEALERRVLNVARGLGFAVSIHHMMNLTDAHPRATMRFALTLQKPQPTD